MSHPSFTPCADCGAALSSEERALHQCEEERRLDHQLLQLRDEIARLEDALAEYLDSPAGRFEAWCAERRRPPLQDG